MIRSGWEETDGDTGRGGGGRGGRRHRGATWRPGPHDVGIPGHEGGAGGGAAHRGRARNRQKELILEAKDEKLRLGREAEEEARARRNELASQERRLIQRDEQLDQRTEMLEQRDRKLLERERELDKAKEDLARATQEQVTALEQVSGMSADDAKSMLLDAVRAEAEHDAVKLARAIERSAR